MKWKKIEVPLYRTTVFFCIEKDGTKVEKKIKSLGLRIRDKDKGQIDAVKNAGCVHPLIDRDESRLYLLWLPEFKLDDYWFDTAVHELTHLKNYIFHHIGQEASTANDEAEAYLVGYLAGEFFKFTRSK